MYRSPGNLGPPIAAPLEGTGQTRDYDLLVAETERQSSGRTTNPSIVLSAQSLSSLVRSIASEPKVASEIEAFFAELARLGSGPQREKLRRVFSSHGLELIGPPLSIE
jgi:hypothetical protein